MEHDNPNWKDGYIKVGKYIAFIQKSTSETELVVWTDIDTRHDQQLSKKIKDSGLSKADFRNFYSAEMGYIITNKKEIKVINYAGTNDCNIDAGEIFTKFYQVVSSKQKQSKQKSSLKEAVSNMFNKSLELAAA